MTDDLALGVDAASGVDFAGIETLAAETNVRQVAFFVRMTRRSADVFVAVGIRRASCCGDTSDRLRPTAGPEILRIADVLVATATRTGVRRSDAVSVRATLYSRTNVRTLWHVVYLGANCGEWTILVVETLDRLLATAVVSISDGSCFAETLVRSSSVAANSARRTRRISAKIDQMTFLGWFAGVARLARTNLYVILRRAYGVDAARIMSQASDATFVLVANFLFGALFVALALDRLAAHSVVIGDSNAVESRSTAANGRVTGLRYLALGVSDAKSELANVTTFRLAHIVGRARFVVSAILVVAATNLLDANVVFAVLILGAGHVGSAGWTAEATDAQLVADTVSEAGTKCRTNSAVAG